MLRNAFLNSASLSRSFRNLDFARYRFPNAPPAFTESKRKKLFRQQIPGERESASPRLHTSRN
jgi:hypothetical protein